MKSNPIRSLLLVLAIVFTGNGVARAQTNELEQLKATMKAMEQTMEQMKAKIEELEKQNAARPAPTTNATAASPSYRAIEKIAEGQSVGAQSPVTYRDSLNDHQEAAARPRDYTLDPQYRGFIPVPNTPALIKLNAKPRLDMTSDNQNTGDKYRFVPAKFPLQGVPQSGYGGSEQFNLNANASQFRLDVRAPEMPGDFRFYYQNDFFGSDTSDMKYRLQHMYGQFYGFLGGYTYGVFEDPDSWPDTVDYEGPNAMIFARRAVAHYTFSFSDEWNATLGVEAPDHHVDGASSVQTVMPDLGYNVRWEKEGVGHVQFSNLYRAIGARSGTGDSEQVFGWGLNLSAGLDLTRNDQLQLLGVYGDGIGYLGNDTSFLNSDAAYTSSGNLEALPYWSGSIGLTHRWNERFRSTVTYGYVNLHNSSGQASTFYNYSHYASGNLVWQLRKRLSVGLEGLYGFQEASGGFNSGDLYRVQLGLVYSLFD
jgi:hypothetical protein